MATVASSSPGRTRIRDLFPAILWGVTYIASRLFLDVELQQRIQSPTWLRVAAALLPVLPTAFFLWAIAASIRGTDELHRRVHLEALAFAYPLAVLLLMTLGLLQLAIDLPEKDWGYRHVWAYLPLFYLLGLALAWRRYR
jgi:hypothetical protein